MTRILWISGGRYLSFDIGGKRETLLEKLNTRDTQTQKRIDEFFDFIENDGGNKCFTWKVYNGMTPGVKYPREDFEVVDD